MARDGAQAVVWQTAINPVVALELLAEGVWSGAGVLGPEAFDAAPFLDLLADYGSPHGCEERDPAAPGDEPAARRGRRPPAGAAITFLSDYGYDDDFVGVCHGVIARIAPAVRVIDVTHGVARHDVRSGALILRRALPYFPAGVHLAVVDPQVGGERRAVAAARPQRSRPRPRRARQRAAVAGGRALRRRGRGGRHRPLAAAPRAGVGDVPRPRHLRAPGRAHGRGHALSPRRRADRPDELVSWSMPRARVEGDELVAHAIAFDRFGNVMLDVEHEELAAFGLRLGDRCLVNGEEAVYATTFADVPPGDAAPLRGRLPDAGTGREPRLGRRAARPRA